MPGRHGGPGGEPEGLARPFGVDHEAAIVSWRGSDPRVAADGGGEGEAIPGPRRGRREGSRADARAARQSVVVPQAAERWCEVACESPGAETRTHDLLDKENGPSPHLSSGSPREHKPRTNGKMAGAVICIDGVGMGHRMTVMIRLSAHGAAWLPDERPLHQGSVKHTEWSDHPGRSPEEST